MTPNQISAAMSVKAARELLLLVAGTCAPLRGSFSTDPLTMAYAEGQRAVGLRILDLFRSAEDGRWFAEALNELLPPSTEKQRVESSDFY